MDQTEVLEQITQKNTFPLRIRGESGKTRYLACPYELTLDNLTLQFYEGNTTIAHFEVVSTDQTPGFKRHFLYSKIGQQHLVTSSGYLFTGPVKVSSWREGYKGQIPEDKDEKKARPIIKNIELFHVPGDEENETAGLDNAVAEHTKRLNGLILEQLTLKSAMSIYEMMKSYVPNY
jgi:hypothetical protein